MSTAIILSEQPRPERTSSPFSFQRGKKIFLNKFQLFVSDTNLIIDGRKTEFYFESVGAMSLRGCFWSFLCLILDGALNTESENTGPPRRISHNSERLALVNSTIYFNHHGQNPTQSSSSFSPTLQLQSPFKKKKKKNNIVI